MSQALDEKRELETELTLRERDAPEPLKLEFRGSASAYFRVWIVNVCLTLLTLGVFSAWATVRSRHYFYSQTVLDGTPFRYLASPIQILKGRFLAVVVFSTWYALSNYTPWLLPVAGLAGALIAPWVLVRAAAFNARYSAFRNITFEFHGTYWGACKVLVSALLLGATGFGIPWAYRNVRRFLTNHTAYAGARARLRLHGAHLFWPWLAGLSVFFTSLVVTAAALVWVFGREEKASELEFLAAVAPVFVGYRIARLVAGVKFQNAAWRQTRLGPLRFDSAERISDVLVLGLTNALACIVSFGLLIPWARVRWVRYRMSRVRIHRMGSLGSLHNPAPRLAVAAAGAETATLFEMDASI